MKTALLFIGALFFFTGFVSNNLISLSINIPQSSKYVQPGNPVFIELSIMNKAIEIDEITIAYTIRDKEKNIIDKKTETVLLATRISLARSLEMPETAKEGHYSFFVEIEKNGKNLATASALFYVGKTPFLTIQNMLITIVIFITLSLLFILYEIRKIKKHLKIDEHSLIKEGLIKIKKKTA